MGAITDGARQELQRRTSPGSYDSATGQTYAHYTTSGDVAAMQEPLLRAMAELEDRVEALQAKLDGSR